MQRTLGIRGIGIYNRVKDLLLVKLFYRIAQQAAQIAPTTYEKLVRPQDLEVLVPDGSLVCSEHPPLSKSPPSGLAFLLWTYPSTGQFEFVKLNVEKFDWRDTRIHKTRCTCGEARCYRRPTAALNGGVTPR
jgi:hypothetical protein